MSSNPTTDNLELWNAVRTPDPKRTKSFTRGGGFRGTAINATYLAQRATEIFGPIGKGWGIEVTDEKYVEGAPFEYKGLKGREVIHVLRVRLWYVLGGERYTVEQYGQTTFVGVNRRGPFTDEEAPKKSLTDGMLKCLSLLGFAADVHLGLFDDNKYVNDARKQFAEDDAGGNGEAKATEPVNGEAKATEPTNGKTKELSLLTAALSRLARKIFKMHQDDLLTEAEGDLKKARARLWALITDTAAAMQLPDDETPSQEYLDAILDTVTGEILPF